MYFKGRGEQRKYLGTRNIRKQIFYFRRTGEQANLFQENNGTGTPLRGPKYYVMCDVVTSPKSTLTAIVI